jgi:hypothetical protein
MTTQEKLDKGARNCSHPEEHEEHMAMNGECPWCGSYDKSKWLQSDDVKVNLIDSIIDDIIIDDEHNHVMDDDLNKWGVQFMYNVGHELGDEVNGWTLDQAIEHFQKYALTEEQMGWIQVHLEEQYNKPYWA